MHYTEEEAKKILEKEKLLKLKQNIPGLRLVRHQYHGIKERPIDIRDESNEGVVFYNLQICYKNQGNISEAKVEDIIWGFRQSGIPNGVTWQGLKNLKKLGYITFTDNMGVILFGDPTEKMWFQWSNKFYELLLESGENMQLDIPDKIKGQDTTIERLR